MKRKDFIKISAVIGAGLTIQGTTPFISKKTKEVNMKAPLAITMWDFSWLERRWPGAGYEDWDEALNQLVKRGYNAIRIDAYPHLNSLEAGKEWTLKPVWNVQDWGSPAINKVIIQPSLNIFIEKCAKYGIKVGLSSWFREDLDNTRMKITTPEILAEQWIHTLQFIEKDGLLDTILYVDLCNEWPGILWCPFFKNIPPEKTWGYWYTDTSLKWMKESIAIVRQHYPTIPIGFSFEFHFEDKVKQEDLTFVDYAEAHIWMAQCNNSEYYSKVGYKYDQFKHDSYENLVNYGEKIYQENKIYWQNKLIEKINNIAEISRMKNLALMTTECWGVVDYKDWPLLEWNWVKELCSLGTKKASATSQWIAIATSNFCGPQFRGMWNDIDWHLQHTDLIKSGKINSQLNNSLIYERI